MTGNTQAAARGGEGRVDGLVLRGPIGDRAASAALSRWRAEPGNRAAWDGSVGTQSAALRPLRKGPAISSPQIQPPSIPRSAVSLSPSGAPVVGSRATGRCNRMQKRYISLWLPHWPAERHARADRQAAAGPLALSISAQGGIRVQGINRAAAPAGRRGRHDHGRRPRPGTRPEDRARRQQGRRRRAGCTGALVRPLQPLDRSMGWTG